MCGVWCVLLSQLGGDVTGLFLLYSYPLYVHCIDSERDEEEPAATFTAYSCSPSFTYMYVYTVIKYDYFYYYYYSSTVLITYYYAYLPDGRNKMYSKIVRKSSSSLSQ